VYLAWESLLNCHDEAQSPVPEGPCLSSRGPKARGDPPAGLDCHVGFAASQ